MARCILVNGCGRGVRGSSNREATLRTINAHLRAAALPSIAADDFTAVHVADTLAVPGGRHRPAPALPYLVARQVAHLVTNPALRIRAIEAVATAIASDTRIVIAHSWGSVAAYDALCLLPQHNVTHFLTLGSPLAIPHYVRGRLAAFSACGRHAWPRTLARWLNFFDGRDPVAWWTLRRHFGDGTRIEERTVRLASANPHHLLAYLASHEVVSSLGDALLSTSTAAAGRKA